MAPVKGQRVWLPVKDDDLSVLATVVDVRPDGAVLLERLHAPKEVRSLEIDVSAAEFAKLSFAYGDVMNPGDDLVRLEDISDATILHTLRLRLQRDLIFTGIGPVLVVVNPYRPVDCCSEAYLKTLSTESLAITPMPHAFTIVSNAYTGLVSNTRGGGSQSILVSGESGAGKTETSKICMSCLAQISGSAGHITEAALESSFLIEAFGNAKTVYNNNSSRFGKWSAVHFDKNNKMRACKIRSYLLEQSRVVAPAPTERNYHFFYYMLAGSDAAEREKFHLLGSAKDYFYTKIETKCPGSDDTACWADMKSKLKLVGFDAEMCTTIFSCIGAVLNLGNTLFCQHKTDSQKQMVAEGSRESQVASALQVPQAKLEAVLTKRTITSGRGSSYSINLSVEQCEEARDALAKAIYAALFDLFIGELNEFLGGTKVDDDDERFIGFLDIFGFENFASNSFEQLCINFTNEKMQAFFTDALIKRQQEEYKTEGVTCAHFSFPDNSAQLDLIDSKSQGVFSLLDEECLVPKGTDETYVVKMNNAFANHPLYSEPTLKRGEMIQGILATDNPKTKISFAIRHYAGDVMYTADKWLDKNKGALHNDLVLMLQCSGNPILSKLFKEWKPKMPSVSFVYRSSLRALSDTMAKTQQHYIRCLKPNVEKKPDYFSGQIVSRQLRYTGCSAVVEIQRSGYPISFQHHEFVRQYRCIAFDRPDLLNDKSLSSAAVCKNILDYAQQEHSTEKGGESWLKSLRVQIGRTKIFMRDDVLKVLEPPRQAVIGRAALAVQRFARSYLVKKSLATMRFHFVAVAAIKTALEKKDVKTAAKKLSELQDAWKGTSVTSPMAAKLQERTAALAVEVDDLKHYEVIEFDGGERYEGSWRGETMNGKGTYYYSSGNVYEGYWKDGAKHGYGKHTWADGNVYVGQWENDTMNGRGKYTFPAGSQYEGEYKNGVRHGEGVFKHANGSVYRGEFQNGKKHGHGTHTDPTGRLVYEGGFVADKEHGIGKFIMPNGAVYEGEFQTGKKTGKAKYTDPSGVVYEGEFVDGQREGWGKYTNPDGSVAHEGYWKANNPVVDAN